MEEIKYANWETLPILCIWKTFDINIWKVYPSWIKGKSCLISYKHMEKLCSLCVNGKGAIIQIWSVSRIWINGKSSNTGTGTLPNYMNGNRYDIHIENVSLFLIMGRVLICKWKNSSYSDVFGMSYNICMGNVSSDIPITKLGSMLFRNSSQQKVI